jgi:hypothetical protein
LNHNFDSKPLDKFKDIPEVCKVLDVAVVPDTPGVCVAVTETYHDVASYHMLHADKQPGKFLRIPIPLTCFLSTFCYEPGLECF